MAQAVIIKSNKHGLVIYLDKDIEFNELKSEIKSKFSESKKFFGNAEMALTIEGKTLSSAQINEVIEIISEVTELKIITTFDNSEVNDDLFKKKLSDLYEMLDSNACEIYPFTIIENSIMEFERSVVILGNVEANAEIHTNGNVFILGSLKGKVYAGELGNKNAKVYVGMCESEDINIADVQYVSEKKKEVKKGFFKKTKEEAPKCGYMFLLIEAENELKLIKTEMK